MARKSPVNKSSKQIPAIYVVVKCKELAEKTYERVIGFLPGYALGEIASLCRAFERNEVTNDDAAFGFMCLDNRLRKYADYQDEDSRQAIDLLIEYGENAARDYFVEKLENELKDNHVADILVEMERLLEEGSDNKFLRGAFEKIKDGAEKKIERQRKRAKIKDDLKMFHEPKPEPTPESVEAEKKLQKKLRDLEAKAYAKQKEIDEKVEKDALARGLTKRRLMYLLDSEMPIFKNASTSAARGEIAYMLTGLGCVTKDGKKGEKIR